MKTRYVQVLHRRNDRDAWNPLTVNDRTMHEVPIGTDETEENTDCSELLAEAIEHKRIPPGSELKVLPVPAADAANHVPPIRLENVLEDRYGPQVIECCDNLGRTYIGTRIDEAAAPPEAADGGRGHAGDPRASAVSALSRYIVVETGPDTVASFVSGNTTQAWLRKKLLAAPADKTFEVRGVTPDADGWLPVKRFAGSREAPGVLPPDDETPRQRQ